MVDFGFFALVLNRKLVDEAEFQFVQKFIEAT